MSRRMGDTSVQVAAFFDHVRNAILTGAGDPSSYSNDVLPDVYSGTFSYGYSPGVSSTGARVVVQRNPSDELTAPLTIPPARPLPLRLNGRLAGPGTGPSTLAASIPLGQSFTATSLLPAHAGLLLISGPAAIRSPPLTHSTPRPARPILTSASSSASQFPEHLLSLPKWTRCLTCAPAGPGLHSRDGPGWTHRVHGPARTVVAWWVGVYLLVFVFLNPKARRRAFLQVLYLRTNGGVTLKSQGLDAKMSLLPSVDLPVNQNLKC